MGNVRIFNKFDIMGYRSPKIRVSRTCEGFKQLLETHLPTSTRICWTVLEKKNFKMALIYYTCHF